MNKGCQGKGLHFGLRSAHWIAHYEHEISCVGAGTCGGYEYLCVSTRESRVSRVTRRKLQTPGTAKEYKKTNNTYDQPRVSSVVIIDVDIVIVKYIRNRINTDGPALPIYIGSGSARITNVL